MIRGRGSVVGRSVGYLGVATGTTREYIVYLYVVFCVSVLGEV